MAYNALVESHVGIPMPDPYHHGVGYPLKGTKQDSIDFATRSYGITSISSSATARLADAASQFNPNYLVTASGVNIIDAIINMPPGFRTKPELLNLNSVPLGLLCYLLRARMRELVGVTTLFDDLVYSGKVTRFKNVPLQSSQSVANTYKNNEQRPYYPIRIERDVDEFEFRQMPLSRVQFIWPFPQTSIADGLDMNPPPTINDRYMNLSNYMGEFTAQPGGSDISFFCVASGGYIFRRYGNMRRTGIPRPMQSRAIRTAGLGQVIFEPLDYTLPGGTKLYVPASSEGNCFEACLLQAYMQEHKEEPIRFHAEIYEDAKRMLNKVLLSCAEERNLDIGEYRKMYRNGYPTVEMKRIALKYAVREGYDIRMWRKNADGKWNNILLGCAANFADSKSITLFQMTDTGEILGFDSRFETVDSDFYEKVDDASLGIMLHAILVYPTPKAFLSKSRNRGKKRDGFVEIVSSRCRDFMHSIFDRNKHWYNIEPYDVHQLVDLQIQRHQNAQTSTLIFNEQKHKKTKKQYEGKADERLWLSRLQEQNGGTPLYYVFAYDLETVDNTSENQDRVYTPYRREVTPEQAAIYDPMESQIPFSAQWIPVNVSDTGEFLKRKEAEPHAVVLDYNENDEKTGFFLGPVETAYSPDLPFGKCIQVMMVSMASWTHARGGKYIIAYAHNGASFDAFVAVQFQPFEIERLLKTSRGILSMSIRVPVVMSDVENYDWRVHDLDVPKVNITFRDTLLQVPGSLSKLCKGFNVPAEYCKLDFPIQLVNANNCYKPDIMTKLRSYGENDVKALGVIIVRINELIGNSTWKPANIMSVKPPIAQFLTCMAMIRASMYNHFMKIIPKNMFPQSVDIPALRSWLMSATMGGRVNAYAKTYCSPYAGSIFEAALQNNSDELQTLYRSMYDSAQCMQCLDVTSLYPYVMDSCPMPTGKIRYITPGEALQHVEIIGCFHCEQKMSLCDQHRHFFNHEAEIRPFSIIIVKNIRFTEKKYYRNMCGRKLYSKTTGKPSGLLYSLENFEEVAKRLPKETLRETESFTNVDLYWMHRQGFRFDIVAGFTFEVSTIYNTFIGPAFKKRIAAKQAGNKLLSDFLKLNYNGSFGVTTQQDITDNFFMCDIEKEYHNLDPRTPEIRKIVSEKLRHNRNEGLSATEELTGEAYYFRNGQAILQKKKKDHLAEYFCPQSPMQIGAAVLAWARHIMNLVMFALPEESMTYTDTDSVAVEDLYARGALKHLIDNRDTAPMGTLKNDHAEENGTEPRIFFSMIGAKKVKCHFTLNQEGKIKIFNTYKGLHVSTELSAGTKMTAAWAARITTKTLFEINLTGSAPPVEVQSWKRDLQFGVSIGQHLQYLDANTYLGDCQGTMVRTGRYGTNTIELFVPHGAIVPRLMDPRDCVFYPVVLDIHGDPSLGDREEEICDVVYSGVRCIEVINDFIDDYYKGYELPYCGDKDNKVEYSKILALFEEEK